MSETERTRRPRKRHVPVLMLLGAALLTVSLIGLYTGPDLLQYAFQPAAESAASSGNSHEEDTGGAEDSMTSSGEDSAGAAAAPADNGTEEASAAEDALARYRQMTDSSVWAGEDVPMCLHGFKRDATVSTDAGSIESDVHLVLAGPRYTEIFPREVLEGNALSASEIASGSPSAVLDSRLAFSLFGDLSPVGRTVRIQGTEYTVTGVARHARSLGASNEMTAWVPLGADASLRPDLLVLSAPHAGVSDGFSTLWKSEAETAFGDGTFLRLAAEKTRASMFPRLLVFFFAVLLMKKWIRLLRRWGRNFLADARRRLARQYAVSLTGYFLLRILAGLLLAGLTLAALYALAVFITRPLLVFPEWVPEKPVALSSILARFWSLIADNAAPVVLVTEEAAVLRFWHFLIRLGTFLFMLGLPALRRREEPERE